MGSSVAIALEKLSKQIMLNEEDREVLRQDRLNEPGTEPPCPWCKKARVSRSDYIRCNWCGVNWLMEEMHLLNYLNRDPRVARAEAARTGSTVQSIAEQSADLAEVKQ